MSEGQDSRKAAGKPGSSEPQTALLRMLGLARRAGRVALGEEGVNRTAERRRCFLIFVAADCAENTKQKIQAAARTSGIQLSPLAITKEALGHAMGRPFCAVLAVTDANFAKTLRALWKQTQET